MVRTAVKPCAGVVDDPVGSVNKGHVLRMVAHLLFGNPPGDVRLGNPETIGPEQPATGDRVVAPTDDAFARRRIVRKSAAGGGLKIVEGLDVKCGGGSGRLRRDDGGVKA